MSELRVPLSIIIPTFDRAHSLLRAVHSVLVAAETDVEVVVVDDGSRDETQHVLAGIRDERLRVVRQDNRGVGAARNAGVTASRGRFLVFLDSDDEVMPGWVEFFRSASIDGVDLAACGVRLVAPSGDSTILVPPVHGAAFGRLRARFLAGAFGLSRDLFDDVGGFRHGLTYSEHTDLALRIGGRMLDHPFGSTWTDRPLVTMYRTDRPYDAAMRYESAMTILSADADHLRRSRRLRATYVGVAAVAASRLGRRNEARRLFGKAMLVDPLAWRHAARFARELLPSGMAARLRSTRPDT